MKLRCECGVMLTVLDEHRYASDFDTERGQRRIQKWAEILLEDRCVCEKTDASV